MEALGYGEIQNDWVDVGRRRDKYIKTAVTSEEGDERRQLTGVIKELKK